MKEEPNTKLYFDRKIARVVFVADEERKVYWFDTTDFHSNYHLHYRYLHNYFYYIPGRLLPIEEWLEEQGMTCVEDDMCLFAMRWLG